MAYASIAAYPSSVSFPKSASNMQINVSCADSTWVVGGGSSWCTITKTSNLTAMIKVTANSGSKRTMAVVCVNGPNVATISITQAGADVTYDRSSKITAYKQDPGKCAGTCACMCVNKAPSTVESDIPYYDANHPDHTIIYPVMWSKVAEKYGYKLDPVDGPATGTISDVFNGLKNGYPVIVMVNDTSLNSTYKYDHWVVVTKYTGKGESDLAIDNFTCVDPNDKVTKPLSSAACFTGIYKYLIYKK